LEHQKSVPAENEIFHAVHDVNQFGDHVVDFSARSWYNIYSTVYVVRGSLGMEIS
jgi:hypothetical protein